jgi:pyruvate formate lyase activating enzyme
MGTCTVCGKSSIAVSELLSLCVSCVRAGFPGLEEHLRKLHGATRKPFGLPGRIPRGGPIRCRFCVNECEVGHGGAGFCGVRVESGGKLKFRSGSPKYAYLQYYYDPLPTNCVADWVCPGNQMRGKHNLAVFYQACTFNCLFCQNYGFRSTDFEKVTTMSDVELAERAGVDTGCMCYFGGDPTPQIIHSIFAARLALKSKDMRICWETNGSMSRAHLRSVIDLALRSGGIIKFDLKTHNENLSLELCGTTNKRTLANFRLLASRFEERETPPLAVASTLLVPGYVDVQEVSKIGQFLASLNPKIPYSLLAFHPLCNMGDLPPTSREHAAKAREAAVGAGLKNVHIGNIHLLSDAPYLP